MDILLIVTGLPDLKEPARSVYNLNYAKELQARGHSVSILYLRALKPGRQLLRKRSMSTLDITEVSCVVPKYVNISLFLFKVVRKNRSIKQMAKRADVIHCVNGNAAPFAFLLAKDYGLPYILQFVGSDVNFDFSENIKYKIYKKSLSAANYLTFNSHKLYETLSNQYTIPNKWKVIYRGVKLENFPFKFHSLRDEVRALFIGGFPNNGNLKGGQTLLQSLKLLDSNWSPNYPVMKVFIGGPNSSNEDYNLKLKNININLLGAVPRGEVSSLMKESHIVIIPSLQEGLPNVLYEAMASGNLIIGSKVGGIPEFVQHEQTGLLVEAQREDMLYQMLARALNNRSDIHRFAEKARSKIENHDYGLFIDSYLDIYNCIKKNEI